MSYLTTTEVAQLLSVSEDWVRSHAGELGGMRLSGRRGPLRFTREGVDAAMAARAIPRPPSRREPARRPRTARGAVELLPLP